MFNNKVSRKELFTSNPGQVFQQQFSSKDFNDSAFMSSENLSDPSSQIENSQGSYDMYSQRFSQSCSQPSENSSERSSQKFYRKYMSKAPLFQRDPTCSVEKHSSKKPSDYLEQLELNKQRAKEKDNRDLLNTFVSLVKDCSDEVKTAVQIIKDSVNKKVSDSADQSAKIIDKLNEGLSVHYQQLFEAIQTKQQLTTSELQEIIATRDAKIELLESQLEVAQEETNEKVMAFLKEAYNEQKQLTKSQLEQLERNQQMTNEKHIKTLQEQQESFIKEKRIMESECKCCDGQGMSKNSDHVRNVPHAVPVNKVQLEVNDTNIQVLRGLAYQSQAVCAALPATVYQQNPVSQTCWAVQPQHSQTSNHTLTNSVKQLHHLQMNSSQQSSVLFHPQKHNTATILPRPLSSSSPEIVSPILSGSTGRWFADSYVKKPSPVATVIPLMKSRIEDDATSTDFKVDKAVQRNGSINFSKGQARKYNSASLKVAPTRQSARLRASEVNLPPRSLKDNINIQGHNLPSIAMEINRGYKRKFSTEENICNKRQVGPKGLQSERNSDARKPRCRNIQQENNAPSMQQPLNCESKNSFMDRKNLVKHKAKPRRKSLKEKCLPRSSSYSDLHQRPCAPSTYDNWKLKRHSSFTIGVDSSSDDDDDDDIFSFADESPLHAKLGEITSSRTINRYPDTEQSSQESDVISLAAQQENIGVYFRRKL
ncbi:uncharacterized protein LOC117105415 isoform X2 [Anneissia japonica]|uniref:uncharacterized protein LOC117105415 isoform X2 n=1 Tax=Anneissia japonica TaxID=1529436 RepID=UPI001425A34A|nr:uncharacterized protein LOC117105415 isoform X2 [Anneissia japonica]